MVQLQSEFVLAALGLNTDTKKSDTALTRGVSVLFCSSTWLLRELKSKTLICIKVSKCEWIQCHGNIVISHPPAKYLVLMHSPNICEFVEYLFCAGHSSLGYNIKGNQNLYLISLSYRKKSRANERNFMVMTGCFHCPETLAFLLSEMGSREVGVAKVRGRAEVEAGSPDGSI